MRVDRFEFELMNPTPYLFAQWNGCLGSLGRLGSEYRILHPQVVASPLHQPACRFAQAASCSAVNSAPPPPDYLAPLPDWIGKANDEHASFLAAVHAKDPDKAARVMSEHVTQAGQHLIRHLETQGLRLSA